MSRVLLCCVGRNIGKDLEIRSKKRKHGIFCRAGGGRLVITQAGGLLEKWRALTFRPAREGGGDPAREAVCHQQ